MKLIEKKDLQFVDGLVVAKDGTVLNMGQLAYEANEIAEMAEVIDFVNTNKAAILASKTEKLSFTPSHKIEPTLATGTRPATPLLDAKKAEDEALSKEWLAHQESKNLDRHLERYSHLAAWFDTKHVLIEDNEAGVSVFKEDILKLTADQVRQVVADFNDPDIRALIGAINITQ
jgi:patatin-like phospholipase/acyl hydrolase